MIKSLVEEYKSKIGLEVKVKIFNKRQSILKKLKK